jgi:hypothetical protein
MATQPRLPGTLPTPAAARKAHAQTVRTVREIHARIETLKAAMREAREALRIADKAREAAEDDLDAIDAGRRPG